MANLKIIATTLALLSSGALVLAGCEKDQPPTDVPAGSDAAPEGDDGMGGMDEDPLGADPATEEPAGEEGMGGDDTGEEMGGEEPEG
jgi:hypothetical protein